MSRPGEHHQKFQTSIYYNFRHHDFLRKFDESLNKYAAQDYVPHQIVRIGEDLLVVYRWEYGTAPL